MQFSLQLCKILKRNYNSLFLKVQQIQIWSAIVNTIFGSSLFTIEMLAFILQLKKFPQKLCKFKLSAALKSSKVFLNVPKTCFSGVDDFLIDNYDLS